MAAPVFATSGLAQAALVETARGPVLARDLRVGDKLVTRDAGLQPLRWIGTSTVVYDVPEATADAAMPAGPGPVRIRAGALGSTPEGGNLVLAPGQRLLVRSPLNQVLFGTDEVLAAAGDLTHLDGVEIVPRSVARWSHPLLDSHQMIRVNGLWMESFAPDMWSIRVAHPEEWHAMTEAVPRLRYDTTAANYVEMRVTIDDREAQLIASI
ncbi:hypothetical protein GCM10011358_16050 [Sinisalibacter lacisalsi]|uniref:Hedgehog/Intein (Hint) domain-containing protein n=2 Tax=Sinisalibacter lacisalsi TaxID=1526570 RepID=A0ABQ1QM20_9RHOB|nr:hypothetical protein GCM10011358_16050 [Sinisalibacter lacisalsi]